MVFKYEDCEGDSIRVNMDDPEGRTKHMNRGDIHWSGMTNDQAASVMVPVGYTLKLFKDEGLKGDWQQFHGKPLTWDGVMEC